MSTDKPRRRPAKAAVATARTADTPSTANESLERIADQLHSAAIHLLRRLRRNDDADGLGAPALSALSVVVHGGPLGLNALAAAEQVSAATMSRRIDQLQQLRLVERRADPHDGRALVLQATARGRAMLEAGRRRRIQQLLSDLQQLGRREQSQLAAALPLLERLARGSRATTD